MVWYLSGCKMSNWLSPGEGRGRGGDGRGEGKVVFVHHSYYYSIKTAKKHIDLGIYNLTLKPNILT